MKLVLLGFLITSCALAQTAAPTLTFHFERPGLDVPVYTFTVNDSGTGTYTATSLVKSTDKYQIGYTGKSETTQPLALNPALLSKLFGAEKASERFRQGCASKAKGIADTGTKTLSYTGPDGSGTCTYNYSDRKPIQELTTLFGAMAYTLDEGRRLESKHKYDRLSLDAELGLLVDAVKEERALGLSNIRPTLQSLVDDPEVLGRVRIRAAKLLELSFSTP